MPFVSGASAPRSSVPPEFVDTQCNRFAPEASASTASCQPLLAPAVQCIKPCRPSLNSPGRTHSETLNGPPVGGNTACSPLPITTWPQLRSIPEASRPGTHAVDVVTLA